MKEVPWNIIDNLIFSIIVYLPIDSFLGCKSTNEFLLYANTFKDKIIEKSMSDVSFKTLELVDAAPRYKNLKIYNFENTTTHDTQFGALTIRTGKETIICYRGTDYALISWIENFRTIYEYPTLTQKCAVDYINNNIKLFGDRNVYVTGHSKGGNLAMVAAMETSNRNFKKIKRIHNFDGPGFRYEEFNTPKFEKMSSKLDTIVPEKSSIGMLLHNVGYQTVKSNAKSILQHYPNSWGVFGEFFLKGTLAKSSYALNERSIEKIEALDYDEAKEAFEAFFESTGKDYTSEIELTFDYMSNLLKDAKGLEPKYQKTLYILFEVMTGINFEPKNTKLQKLNERISNIKSNAKSGAQKFIDKKEDIKRDKKLKDKKNDSLTDQLEQNNIENSDYLNNIIPDIDNLFPDGLEYENDSSNEDYDEDNHNSSDIEKHSIYNND